MNNYTLLIIDMQSNFQSSLNPKTINAVREEIQKAKESLCDIIVVEFKTPEGILELLKERGDRDTYADTHEEIMKDLTGYKKYAVVEKYECNGSYEVREFILNDERNFNMDYFRVCGVNTDACVARTVNGLWEDFDDAEFKVVKDACNYDPSCPIGPRRKMLDPKTMEYNPYNAFFQSDRIKFV